MTKDAGTDRYVHQEPPGHGCRTPPTTGHASDWTSEHTGPGRIPKLKPGVRLPVLGDVWECDCGQSWVLRPGGAVNGGRSSPRWTVEGRFEAWFRRRRETS